MCCLQCCFRTKGTRSSSVLSAPAPLPAPRLSRWSSSNPDTKWRQKLRVLHLFRDLQDKASNCVILPNHPIKEGWDILLLCLILYSGLVVPVEVGFNLAKEVGSPMWCIDATVSLMFLLDLCLNFFTAFDIHGTWETSRRMIASRYLLGWFWVDAPSSIPVEFIELVVKNDNSMLLTELRFIRVLRLVRLARLLKLDTYIARIEEILEVNLRALRLVQLTAKLLFIAHVLACAWAWIALRAEAVGEQSWASAYHEGSDEELSLGARYLDSVYWALTTLTTVGYGDIIPVSRSERVFASFSLLVGGFTFAMLIGEIGTTVASMDQQASLVNEKMEAIKEYLIWRKVPKNLRIRIRRYYEHYYTREPVFDEDTILGGLNPLLQAEVSHGMLTPKSVTQDVATHA